MLTYRKYQEEDSVLIINIPVGGSNALLWGSTLKKAENGTDGN